MGKVGVTFSLQREMSKRKSYTVNFKLMAVKTAEKTSKENGKRLLIPGGLTKYLQAADVVWNGPFKAQMRGCYDNWLSEPSLREYTKGGNPRAPQRSLICNWVKQCWDNIRILCYKHVYYWARH